jgi:hypothetical protein
MELLHMCYRLLHPKRRCICQSRHCEMRVA